jgi:hypothetical protein
MVCPTIELPAMGVRRSPDVLRAEERWLAEVVDAIFEADEKLALVPPRRPPATRLGDHDKEEPGIDCAGSSADLLSSDHRCVVLQTRCRQRGPPGSGTTGDN